MREVLPHIPDAWIDEEKTKIEFEISFNRRFCVFKLRRELDGIGAELKRVTDRIGKMIGELACRDQPGSQRALDSNQLAGLADPSSSLSREARFESIMLRGR